MSSCECTDTGCHTKHGTACSELSTQTLYRVDMADEAGLRFCDLCGDDAMESGLFTDGADDGPDTCVELSLDQLSTLATDVHFQEFFQGYLECAVWSSTSVHPEDFSRAEAGEDCDQPLEEMGLGVDDISDEARVKLMEDALDFWNAQPRCHRDPSQAGHDFWLSRNGHGAGFFDGHWDEHGDDLQAAARVYGSVDLYVDEKEMIQVA